jgi:tetratricopeptide (TPR) repeat protein
MKARKKPPSGQLGESVRPAIQAKPPAPANRHLLVVLALCAVTLLAFSNSFSAGFPLDNKGLILQDARIHESTSQNIDQILQHSYWWPRGNSGLYRPVTTLSYLFNYAVLGDGDRPAGYHWVNMLLHLGNVMLVYVLALKLIGDFWPSAMLAGLWAVHPVLTESVTNIVGRPDLLAGMALLSGALLYLKSAESGGVARIAWLAGLMAVTAAGVFSKESAAMIVGVILLYELTWWKNRRQALILGLVAVLAPLEALLYQRSFVFAAEPPSDFPFTDNPLVAAGFWQAKLTAIKVIGRYLGLTVWPIKLSADYSYNEIPLARGSMQDWLAWLVVGAAVVGILLLYRRNRTAFFWACFAFLAFLPTSNLLFPIGTIMAERFLYIPSIGLLACLVMAAYAAGRHFRIAWLAPAVLGVFLCGFTARTWARNADWQDEISLGRAAVEASPQSFKSHQILAEALYAADASHGNVDAVIDQAEKALAVLDSLPNSQNMAEIYRLAGECYRIKADRLGQQAAGSPESVTAYRRALSILERGAAIQQAARDRELARIRSEGKSQTLLGASPNDDIYRLLSAVHLRLGDGDKAFESAIEGRKYLPLNPAIYSQLAQVLAAGGQPEDAATALMEGMLLTSDMGLRQELMALYRAASGENACAITTGPNGPAINPKCPLVHRNLCEASVDAVRIRVQTGRKDLAAELKRSFLNDYGCPAEPLNQALPDASGSR